MLLTKTFLHWNYFSYRQKYINTILGYCLSYFLIKNKIFLIIQFLYLLKTSILFRVFPSFKYYLQVKAPCIKQLQSINIFNYNNLQDFPIITKKANFQIKYIKKNLKSLLRSSFVFKKSQEQLCLINISSQYSIDLYKNILISFFFEVLLIQSILKKIYFSKISVKKSVYF